MNILVRPFTQSEKRGELDMLDGNICRICISNDPEEIVRNLGFATDRLSMLAYSRIKQVMENRENENN